MPTVNGREVELPKDGHSYRIWSVVEELILERYDQVKDERMRDSYYLLREWLEPKRDAGEISDDEFDYFVENYEYYRDGFWPRAEKNHGIRRPETKPPTVVIERGEEYTESRIEDAWERARGFLFVEKSGMAEDLELLSEHGWLIIAAQGESTRTFREKAANDGTDRPILVVTDADFYGGGITESIKGHSDRTEHLDLARKLEHRVQEVGLTQDDADALDLPRERDPTQSPDEWRTELNALTVLKERRGVENPLLCYVSAKMAAEDIPLCPAPYENPAATVRASLRSRVEESLGEAIDDAVAAVMEDFEVGQLDTDGDGEEFVSLRGRQLAGGVDASDVADELESVAEDRLDTLKWWHQSRYEDMVEGEIGRDDYEAVAGDLE